MAIKKTLTSSSPIPLFLLLISLTTLNFTKADIVHKSPNHTHHIPCSKSRTCQRLKARDALALSDNEIVNTIRYINSIPRFKSVQAMAPPHLNDCLHGIAAHLSLARTSLHNLAPLRGTTLGIDANSIKLVVLDSLEYEYLCHDALRDVDDTIALMLKQKLNDVLLTVENAAYRVRSLDGLPVSGAVPLIP